MNFTLKQFKEKSFLIPLATNGEFNNYQQFNAKEWENHILTFIKLVIKTEQPKLNDNSLNTKAKVQLNNFISHIKQHLSPEVPCLAIAFPPGNCWFVAFVAEAFVPFENSDDIFKNSHYAKQQQTVEIIKHKGDPISFAFSLVQNIEKK